MLTPEQLAHCADDMIWLYSRLENDIIRDITRRIVKTGTITDTANFQMDMLQEAGALYDDIIQRISKQSGTSENALRQLFEESAVKAMEYDSKIYLDSGLEPHTLRMSLSALQVLEAGYNKTQGNLANLTRTTANTSQWQFVDACSLAELKVSTGGYSYQTAVWDAVLSLAKNGLEVEYPSGHRDKLDVAVRRNVMTGIGQTTGEICLGYAREMGCDLMEITAHAGARPSHASWQGQIVSLSGRKGYLSLSDIGYGTGAGFKGWNCRHDWYPYFEGSTRMYSDKDLQALNDRDIEFPDGSKHTLYEAEQMQRKYERAIRQTRRELCAADEVLNTAEKGSELYNKARQEYDRYTAKIKYYEQEMKDFCEKTKLFVDNSRIRTYGYGKSISQKVVHNDKAMYENYKYMLGDKATARNIHEFNYMAYNGSKEYNLFKNVEAVNKMYKTDFGSMTPMQIYNLDQMALHEKRSNFTAKYKYSGNFAIMEYNGEYYYAHSLANSENGIETEAYKKYKGDKSHLATTSEDESKRNFTTFDVVQETGRKAPSSFDGNLRTNTFLDTEAKLLETLENSLYNDDCRTIYMLSERGMCDSCKDVVEQFITLHPEVEINIVSNIDNTGNPWKGRR